MRLVGHVSGRELLKGLKTVEEIVSLGIGVELQLTGEVLDSFTYKDYSKIAQLVGELPITVHAPFMELNPGALEPKALELTRERFEETLSAAKVLNAQVVVFHTGYHPRKVEPVYEVWLSRAIETFKGLASSYGGRLALENVFDSTPKNLKALISNLPENVGVCIDVGHLNLFSSLPLREWIEPFKGRIYEFHVHDNSGLEDEHAPIGRGSFDFNSFFSLLEEVEDDYIFNLENKTPKDVEESLRALRRFKWIEKLESTPMKS